MDATKIDDLLAKDSRVNNDVYLFIDSSVWPRLIPNQEAYDERKRTNRLEHFIPDFEVWYPGDIPLKLVCYTLYVKTKSSKTKNVPVFMRNLME